MSILCSGVIRANTRRDVTASARSSADSVSHWLPVITSSAVTSTPNSLAMTAAVTG